MASTDTTEKSPQAKEVEQVKSDFGKDCRVIVNIGDFAHVLDIKLKCDLDIHIKFQLEDTYPSTPAHVVVKSKSLQAEDSDALAVHLTAFAVRHKGKPLVRPILKEAQKWLKEQPSLVLNDASAYDKEGKSKKKLSPKSRRKKNQEKQLEDETKDQKLPSMKTAIDVVSRILWDESLERDDFIVGYLDRMLGVLEKKFALFSWEDVASVDYNTLAIPKHRIQYFKYKDVVVWDKNKRFDDVFGSTGGKTIDEVISKYKRDHPEGAAAAAISEPGQYTLHHEKGCEDDDDDDDDGITIDTGYQAAAASNVESTAVDDAENWKPADDGYWGPKKRPTHFLALRVTNPDVVSAIANIHDVILNMEPRYGTCIIPPERIHVTLACLGLDTPDDVNKAADALASLKEELLESWEPHDMSLKFKDIGNFFNSVLYAKVEASEKFMNFVEHLRTAIVVKGIEIRDVFDFTPHMTIIKLKRQLGREVLHTRYLDQRLYSVLAGSDFGSQIVNNIHLCDMSEDREADGFYITPKRISFP